MQGALIVSRWAPRTLAAPAQAAKFAARPASRVPARYLAPSACQFSQVGGTRVPLPQPAAAAAATAAAPGTARAFHAAAWAQDGAGPKRYYTKEHEWVTVDGKGVGTIGITAYAAEKLGEVVFVELPEVGKVLKAGDSFGAIESVKAASDVYAPVAGKVIEANSSLEAKPETINESPLKDGWLCKIQLTNKDDLTKLMEEAGYVTYTSE